ncbi:EthD domain-containing protein [Aspergillus germanicus]
MATPVTEVGFFTFLADANIAKALADIETIALRQPGIHNLSWGRFENKLGRYELPQTIRTDGHRLPRRRIAILTPTLAGQPLVFYAELNRTRLRAVMDALIVEMITFFSVAADFSDIARSILEAVYHSAGAACAGFMDGPVIEAIRQDGGGNQKPGLMHFAAVNWKTVDARTVRLSPDEFHTCYEAHAALIKHPAGDTFPVSHRRTYIARTTVHSPPPPTGGDTTSRNPTTPATMLRGAQADADFDAIAELTFADQAAFERFVARVQRPEVAAEIKADEEGFLETERVTIVMVGEVCETRR